MNYSKKIHFAILFSLFVHLFSSAQKKNNSSFFRKLTLSADSIVNPQIEIQNKGNKAATFSFQLNKGFYLTEDEMVEQIKNMPQEFSGERLERKAWRYVMEHVKFSKSLSPEKWQHSPEVIINSIGNGQCDDLASTLSILWRKLGFTSRVWGLEGHVVPEVFIDGRWQMFDPSHQMYYHNSRNEIAGVEELSKNPELITTPKLRKTYKKGDVISTVLGHSAILANVYSTDTNNGVNTDYEYSFEVKNKAFSIPQGASIKFPVKFGEMNRISNPKIPEYSFLSVELLANNMNALEIPLVLYAIEGEGKATIDSIEFSIGSKQLKEYLHTFNNFHYNILATGNTAPVKMYYLLNRNSFSIQKKNTIAIEGNKSDSILVTISSFADKDTLPQLLNIDSILNVAVTHYEKNKEQFDKKFNSVDPSLPLFEKIIKKMDVYIDLNAEQSKVQKSERKLLLTSKLQSLIDKKSKQKKLLGCTEEPYLFILLLTFVEFSNETDLMKTVQ